MSFRFADSFANSCDRDARNRKAGTYTGLQHSHVRHTALHNLWSDIAKEYFGKNEMYEYMLKNIYIVEHDLSICLI
jgi:hypothetical protein